VVWAEIAHQMALLPLVWLSILSFRGRHQDAAYWWIAAAFAVSWLADTAAHFTNPWAVSLVYPVTQTAVIGAVLLPRRSVLTLILILVASALVTVMLRGDQVPGPDVFFHTIAWGAVCWLVADKWYTGRIRTCLLVYFGLGWVGWMIHTEWLIVPTWFVFQSARLAGLCIFCWAAMQTGPNLRVSRA
jgi:hypothetical protein